MNVVETVSKVVDLKNDISGEPVYSTDLKNVLKNPIHSSEDVDIGTPKSDGGSQDTFSRAEIDPVKDVVNTCYPDNRATSSERRVDDEQSSPVADEPHTDTTSASKPSVFYLGGEDGPRSSDSLPTMDQHYVSV